MALRFTTFRLVLTSLMILLSGTSIGLALSVMRVFSHPHVGWIVISIQLISIIRAVFSITRKQLFKSSQSVASEAVGLFVLFPFQLVLALAIVSGPFSPEADNLSYAFTLQMFVLINSAIQLLYTIGIIVTAALTVSAFDRDVWARDIDASPSPFPVPVVLAFYFPCCFYLPQSGRHETNDKPVVPCFPGCNCTPKTSTLDSAMAPEMLAPRARGILSGWKSSGSLSRTLVRVPNAAERRSSITIAFEV